MTLGLPDSGLYESRWMNVLLLVFVLEQAKVGESGSK